MSAIWAVPEKIDFILRGGICAHIPMEKFICRLEETERGWDQILTTISVTRKMGIWNGELNSLHYCRGLLTVSLSKHIIFGGANIE